MFEAFVSRSRLARYVASAFAVRIAVVLVALLALVLTVDVLGESNSILAQPGAGGAELWRYMSLRIPILASQFAPFAVLLAALATIGTFAYTGQVVAMKAAGLSTGRITAPMMGVGVCCALLHLALNESLTVRATAALEAWQAAGYGQVAAPEETTEDVWVEARDTVIRAASAELERGTLSLKDITLFRYRPDGALFSVTQAARGQLTAANGRLEDVEQFDFTSNLTERYDTQPWPLKIAPEDFFRSAVNPDHVGALALYQDIEDNSARGSETSALTADFHHKLSWPMACIMMPLFAGFAASSFSRTGSVLLRNGAALLFGFSYFVFDSFAMAMARSGALPPAPAPWMVIAIFFLAGQAILLRVNR